MDNLDSATQHWVSQGGHLDAETEGHRAMWDHAQEPSGESWNDTHNAEIDDAVSAAVTEVRGRDSDREDWNNSKADRHALQEAYPNSPGLESYVADKLAWNDLFRWLLVQGR
jgi:hypothetical protein